jgi:Flp pilus assembly protein TadB
MCYGQHPRPVTRGLLITLGAGTASASIVAAPWWITVSLLGLPLIVLAAIFLPAVWSRRPARRRDARLLSERILRVFERRRR